MLDPFILYSPALVQPLPPLLACRHSCCFIYLQQEVLEQGLMSLSPRNRCLQFCDFFFFFF